MKNLEDTEIRGLSIKRLVTYVTAVLFFIVGLVVRDVKRENQLADCKVKIEAVEKQLDAATKDREALKIIDNNHDNRLTMIETKIEFLMKTKR